MPAAGGAPAGGAPVGAPAPSCFDAGLAAWRARAAAPIDAPATAPSAPINAPTAPIDAPVVLRTWAYRVNAAFANYRRQQIGAHSSPPTRVQGRRLLTPAQVAQLQQHGFPLKPMAGLPYILVPLCRPSHWPARKTVASVLSVRRLADFVAQHRARRQAVRLRRNHQKRGGGVAERRFVTPVPDDHDLAAVLRATLAFEGLGAGAGDPRTLRGVQVLESAAGCRVQQYHLDHASETHRRSVKERALSVIAAVHLTKQSKVRVINTRTRRAELVTIPAGHALVFRCDVPHSGYKYAARNLRLFGYFFSDAHAAEAADDAGRQRTHRLAQRDVAAMLEEWEEEKGEKEKQDRKRKPSRRAEGRKQARTGSAAASE